ncbi:TonB-dependent receptor [Seonamhaeicola sp. NFXS20]|uniref:SusC/RagA family TonB-linked outer membrane protein n=1 Tax=Seonamhaeicola sp. NFXS20 TaxID=2816959 RepID=UPI003B8CC1C8
MSKRILSLSVVLQVTVLLLFITSLSAVYGQSNKTITGVVVDQLGVPVPGVSIVIKGTTTGTTTDFDGNYSITVKGSESILVFSYMGFVTVEKLVSSNRSINVVLEEDIQSLGEVVVVGYGAQKKETVTGAISTIKGGELADVPTSNLSTAITGKLPGVVTVQSSGRPGEDAANVFIRGQSTWVDSSPLIIVDGVERNTFSQIDPNEIESISVLKDASSTAVYGVKGANGVILITTKRGKLGEQKISVSANFSVQQPVAIPEFLGSYDHLVLRKQASINDGLNLENDPLISDESLEGYRLGVDKYRYPDINWYDEVIKSAALQQKYNINVSGGTEKVKYFVSLGYLDQSGMFKYTNTHNRYSSDTDFKRFNFRSNLDFKINEYQIISANISGRKDAQNGFPNVSNVFQSLIAQVPYAFPIYNPDGSYAAIAGQANPIVKIAESGYDRTDTNNYDIVGSLKNDLSFITDGLTLDMNLSYNSSTGSTKSYREQADTFQYNPNTDDYDQITEYTPLTYSGESATTTFTRLGIQFAMRYTKKIGKSKVNTTLVYNQQNEKSNTEKPFVLMGYAGRVEYDYDSKYLAEFNMGYNGSENFAPGNRFGFFPAMSFGYVLSRESFMEPLSSVVKFLKIRGSAGLVGNDKIGGSRFLWQGLYQYLPATGSLLQYIGFGTTNPSSSGGIYETRTENRLLTWEKSLKQNIGLEAKLFENNSLNISFDVFNERRTDILMSARSLLSTTGIPSPQYNIGEVKNWGYEIDANYRNTIGEVKYSLRGLYSFARNEIVNYDDPQGTPTLQKYEGYRIGQYRGYKVLGFFTSQEDIDNSPDQTTLGGPIIPGDLKYEDVNGDGQINESDIQPIGYSQVPEIVYSITPEISWKGFTLNATFQGAANASVLFTSNAGFEFGGAAGGGQVTKTHQDYWTEDNQDASYPALHLNPQHSNKNVNSFHLKSGNYIRLRNIQLSYELPEQVCEKLNVSNIRVLLSGNNVKTWSKVEGFDPETVDQSGETYPQQKVYSLGVNINL